MEKVCTTTPRASGVFGLLVKRAAPAVTAGAVLKKRNIGSISLYFVIVIFFGTPNVV